MDTHIQRSIYFATMSSLLVMIVIITIIASTKPIGDAPMYGLHKEARVGDIELWEYQSKSLKCLISIHVSNIPVGSFTQISCTK